MTDNEPMFPDMPNANDFALEPVQMVHIGLVSIVWALAGVVTAVSTNLLSNGNVSSNINNFFNQQISPSEE